MFRLESFVLLTTSLASLAGPRADCTNQSPPTEPEYVLFRNEVTRPMDKRAQLEVLRAAVGNRCVSSAQASNLVSYFSGFGTVPDLRIEATVLLALRLVDPENLFEVLAQLGAGQADEVQRRIAALNRPASSPAGPTSASGERCYQLAARSEAWARTPELLCLTGAGSRGYLLTLKTGIPEREFARFHVDLLTRDRCADCNRDRFGVPEAANSAFRQALWICGKPRSRFPTPPQFVDDLEKRTSLNVYEADFTDAPDTLV